MNTLAMLNIFDNPEAMEGIKKDFRDNFMRLWKEREAQYCAENQRAPVMTPELATEVMGYLDRCNTPFHVEALKSMVLVNLQLPNNFADLDAEANVLMTRALTDK